MILIFFLVEKPHWYTIRPFLLSYGSECRAFVSVLDYQQAMSVATVSPGAYVFCDIERLSASEAEAAARLRQVAASAWGEPFVFNHPTVSWTRIELLQRLHQAGINLHTAARADGALDGLRFPVFVRREDEHMGSETGLIYTAGELREQLRRLRDAGKCLRNRMVVEHCDLKDEQGLYNLRAAHRFGDRLYGGHLYVSREWEVKERNRLTDEKWMRLEEDYLRDNPDAEQVLKVFDLAGIQYGRIDYCRHGERLEVWEINTNPTHMSHQIPRCDIEARNVMVECDAFRQALSDLQDRWRACHPGRLKAVRWRPPGAPWYAADSVWRKRLRSGRHACLLAMRRGMDRIGLERVKLRKP